MSELVKVVQELMKLPQSLCKACGKCCYVATYRGSLPYEEVKKIAESTTEDPFIVQSTKDFLTIFEPYESIEEARKIAPEFVDEVLSRVEKNTNVAFFHCRFVGENKCLIHEDRPDLCRAYPIVHERTIFFESCGYKDQCKKNWAKIKEILDTLNNYKKELKNQSESLAKNKSTYQ